MTEVMWHNAAPRVRCVQCEIRLPRELSGAGPDVQGLSSRHARPRARRERAAEWSRRERTKFSLLFVRRRDGLQVTAFCVCVQPAQLGRGVVAPAVYKYLTPSKPWQQGQQGLHLRI
jgi:hypothetical protein